MESYRADSIKDLKTSIGETVILESLREAVSPPYLMLMPFIEVPEGVVIEGQHRLDEEGVHGCTYQLKAVSPVEGKIVVGFRDLQTQEVTHRKVIQISSY